MSGVACGSTMRQGDPWGFTEACWRWWKGSTLYLVEEGNKEACGPRASWTLNVREITVEQD